MKISPNFTKFSKEQIKMLYALESKDKYYSEELSNLEANNLLLTAKQYDILTLFLELKRLNYSYEIEGYDYIILNLTTLEKALDIAKRNINKYMKRLKNYALLDWNSIKVDNSIRKYDTIIKFDSNGIIKLLNCISKGINKNSPLLKGLNREKDAEASINYITKELEKYQSLLQIKDTNSNIKTVMNKIKKGYVPNTSLDVLRDIISKNKTFSYQKEGSKVQITQTLNYDENYYISVIENGISGLIRLKLEKNTEIWVENLKDKVKIEVDEEGRIIDAFLDERELKNNASKNALINIYSFYLIYDKLKFIISKIKNLESKKICYSNLANVLTSEGYTQSGIFDTTFSTTSSFSNFLNSIASNFRNSSNYFILDSLQRILLEKFKNLKYSAAASQDALSELIQAEKKMFKLVYNFVSGGIMKKPKDFVKQETKKNNLFEKIEEQVESAYKIWNEKDNFNDRREKQISFITPHLVDDKVKLKCVIDFIDLRKPKSLDFQEELFFIAKHNSIISRKTFTNRLNEVKKAEQKNIHCKTLGIAKNSDILDKQDKLYCEEEKSRLEEGIEVNKRKLENVLTGEIIEMPYNDSNDYLETLFLEGENRECKISKKSGIYTITYWNKQLQSVTKKYKEVM